MRIRTAALTGSAGLAVLVGAAAQPALSARERTVPCGESIATTKWPFLGSSQPQFRYRLVLGVIAVPPPYLEQVVATHEQPWPYWRKAGLVIRAGAQAVTVTVPKTWRPRAAISWGYGGHGTFTTLRIEACGSQPSAGNAYSGGFHLRSHSVCLPLVFHVGTRSATVRFGLGRACP